MGGPGSGRRPGFGNSIGRDAKSIITVQKGLETSAFAQHGSLVPHGPGARTTADLHTVSTQPKAAAVHPEIHNQATGKTTEPEPISIRPVQTRFGIVHQVTGIGDRGKAFKTKEEAQKYISSGQALRDRGPIAD